MRVIGGANQFLLAGTEIQIDTSNTKQREMSAHETERRGALEQ